MISDDKKSILERVNFVGVFFTWSDCSYNECKDFCAPAQGDCSAYYATTHQAPPDLRLELVHNGFVVEREGAEGVGAPLQFPSAVLLKSLWGQATLNHPAASALETRLQVAQEENSCQNKMAVKFSYQGALLGWVWLDYEPTLLYKTYKKKIVCSMTTLKEHSREIC